VGGRAVGEQEGAVLGEAERAKVKASRVRGHGLRVLESIRGNTFGFVASNYKLCVECQNVKKLQMSNLSDGPTAGIAK
jgi:hypothetical protein